MSYCRFHNTNIDLDDCLNALLEDSGIGDSERKCGIDLFENFLNFCVESNVIDDYDSNRVESLFEEMANRKEEC